MSEEKWLVDGPKVIDLGPITKLKLALVRGQVDIVGHDEPTTRVEVHSVSGKELRITVTDGVLEIDHPQVRWDNFIEVFRSFKSSAHADVSILVPHEVALDFGVVSAGALISGLTGDASINTVSGDIVVDGLTGKVGINAVSGEVAVRNHTGEISVHTVSGDITASGAVKRFSSDGVSGATFLDVTGSPDLIRVNTVSGDITTRLEEGVGAQYNINTVSGRIQLDDAEIRGVRGSYTGKFGTLDQHWLDFRANTVGGNIAVLHAASSNSRSASAGK